LFSIGARIELNFQNLWFRRSSFASLGGASCLYESEDYQTKHGITGASISE